MPTGAWRIAQVFPAVEQRGCTTNPDGLVVSEAGDFAGRVILLRGTA